MYLKLPRSSCHKRLDLRMTHIYEVVKIVISMIRNRLGRPCKVASSDGEKKEP